MEIFKDQLLTVSTPEKPAVKGHVQVVAPMAMNEFTKDDFAELLSAGSFSSNVLFEALGAQGTNILITEGEGVRVDVLARTEGDGVEFQWEPQQVSPEDMESIATKIKDKCDYIGQEGKPKPEVVEIKKTPDTITVSEEEQKEAGKRSKNYLVRQLERIP